MTFFTLSLVAVVLFATCYLSFGLFAQKKLAHQEYSFRQYFPFELTNNLGNNYKITLYVLEGLTLLSSLLPAGYALSLTSNFGTNERTFLILVELVSLLPALAFLFLSLVNMYYPKQHLSLYFVLGAGEILKDGMFGYYFVNAYRLVNNGGVLLAIAIILFAFALLAVFLLLNPALKRWDRMDKVAKNDGTVSYVRPKRFILAYSEWALYFGNLICDILVLIGIYLSSLLN
jgi:hypothetical protein